VAVAALLLAAAVTAGADEAAVAPAPAEAPGPQSPPAAAPTAAPAAPAKSVWSEVHPAAGVGITIRTNKITGKLVPASVTWKDDHYEFFVAYFRDQEVPDLTYQGFPAHIGLAPPMWAYALSRRFNFVDRQQLKAFAGVGVAYLDTHPCDTAAQANDMTPALDAYERVYHGCNKLDGSRLNYALQLGVRLYMADHSQGVELVYRHISDAGMTNGNRGEDFVTAALVF
jgi:hypothetical protein